LNEALRRDAQLNRERLLRAAEAVFAEQGLDAPVDEIARCAGVGLGTLYRRFPTKDALIEVLVQELSQDVLAAGRQALEQPDGTGLESLMWGIGEIIAGRRGCLTRLWNSPASKQSMRQLDGIIATLLKRAKTAGTIRAECTRTDVSLTIWGLRGVIETAAEIAPDAWRRQLDLCLAGMRPCGTPFTHPPMTVAQKAEITGLNAGPGSISHR
jgi:AcrR family transcriptional regulator